MSWDLRIFNDSFQIFRKRESNLSIAFLHIVLYLSAIYIHRTAAYCCCCDESNDMTMMRYRAAVLIKRKRKFEFIEYLNTTTSSRQQTSFFVCY